MPTTGLTVADVADLAVRVHDQMVAALREISDPSAAPPPRSPAAPAPAPAPASDSSPAREKQRENSAVEAPVEPSRADAPVYREDEAAAPLAAAAHESQQAEVEEELRRREGSENGTETEEDEGMVLVGRPGAR